jgi:hypothetical protein
VRVVLLAAGLLCLGCRLTGTHAYYGVSTNEMNFGEVDFVLTDQLSGRLQGVPFVVAGRGTLPAEYGPERESYDRLSGGLKARYPWRLLKDKLELFLEAGGMVSYYQADAIITPYELEVIGGLGGLFRFGEGWSVDLGWRIRHPTGNGSDHKSPNHAPHGTAPEIVFGLRKDF